MFDFDAGKLMIIATVALVVIGPKDLPRVLRQMGQIVNRLRRMANEFQGQFMDAMKEADLQDIKAEVAKLKDSATLDIDFDPAREIKTHLDDAINAPAMTRLASAAGSTSELEHANLPAPSEIEPAASIAGAGFGPATDIPALPEPAHAVDIVPVSAPEPAEAAPVRRKAILVRRRPSARSEGGGGRAPAPSRSRNILPARRETPEQ